jgi:hypothetical protein
MKAGGKTIAEGRLERTIPIQFSIVEGLDVGLDTGSAVDFTYQLPFRFSGEVAKVSIEIRPPAEADASAQRANAMQQQ